MDLPTAMNESMASRVARSLRAKVLGPVEQRVQLVVDKAAPYPVGRWIGFAVLLTLYGTWVYTRPGWYIVTYGLGIYMLNLLVGFVTPIEDPDAGDGRPLLPVRGDDTEAKPLQTKLPELKFWTRAVRAVLVAFTLTLFDAFNVEVFWPILLFYFIMLFFFTCRRQVGHMIRWKYSPFSWGKKTYVGIPPSSSKAGSDGPGAPMFTGRRVD